MRILTASEQEAFDKPPLLDHRERKQFFSLPKDLMDIATSLRTPDTQIGFVLVCGYFRAARRFYLPYDFHTRDIQAAATMLDLVVSDFSPDRYPKQTRTRHQQLVMEFHGFAPFDGKAEAALVTEITTMTRTHLKPRLIFDRCADFLTQGRVQVPRSGTLLELIRSGMQAHKVELIALMNAHLTDETRGLLDDLFTAPEEQNRYRLTLLKKLSQSTKPTRIKEAVADFETLAALHSQLEDILSILDLGVAGIRYYAGSVLKSRMFQLQQRSDIDRYIHATAFVAHQFFRMQDNLVDLWLSVMASFQTAVSRDHKERVWEGRKDQQQQIKAAVHDLDTEVFGLIREIRRLASADDMSDTQKVCAIRGALEGERTDSFERLKAGLDDIGQDRGWHNVLEAHSLRLQNRLKPILRVIAFEPNERAVATRLIAAIDHFTASDGNIGPRAPTDFLDPDEHTALAREDGTFRPSLYKVFLFQHVTSAIKSGDLNLASSYKYRPMNSYLIDADRWNREKAQLLERAGLAELADPAPVLAKLDDALHAQYRATNANASGNKHLKIRTGGVFHVATPAVDVAEADQLGDLFPERHDVPLAQVLETVNGHCDMLSSLEHWQQTHIRQAASRPALLAGIMGLGCAIGVRKMARISSRVTESELEHTVNWRFSIDNIRAANDAVAKAMDEMELPNLYRREAGALHTASDGQKFEVRSESLHASRSFKYFGQGQGVSAYTFADERHFLWHSLMISAADRESAYVIDGLMHNDVVKSDIHSTDTHGYTEAVFGLTHLLGFSFAPRIKGVGKQRLYLFRGHDRTNREDWKIAPAGYVNDALIRDNWDDMLRLVATIKLKENTASDIFRRLNSYSRQHALYQTLKAFGQIIKSLFILRYIDDLALRQAIEKQLNKVELANRFTRAVAVGNPREFTQAEKEEQEIAEACNRLIKNSIICWNYLYLARRIEKTDNAEAREALLRMIATHSPMAWAHIN
ncbi:MAG: Tn3 family transposase, partial [Verrucomicrobia bacterium]|nr:Tn3 family transposase [Verrucomicrobiota bacterium]